MQRLEGAFSRGSRILMTVRYRIAAVAISLIDGQRSLRRVRGIWPNGPGDFDSTDTWRLLADRHGII
jgi:hypothetical protein